MVEGPRDRERLRTVVVADADELATLLADRIVATIQRATADTGRCVLGLATGSTPLGVYHELIRRHAAGAVDFSRVVTTEETVEKIVKTMLALHPDRDNPRVVWHCAREAVKKREQA